MLINQIRENKSNFCCSIQIQKNNDIYLATGGYKGKIIILQQKVKIKEEEQIDYKEEEWEIIHEVQVHQNQKINENAFVYSEKKDYIISGGFDHYIKIINFERMEIVNSLRVQSDVYCVKLFGDNKIITSGRLVRRLNNPEIRIFSLDDFTLLKCFVGNNNKNICDLIVLDDRPNEVIAVGGKGICLWDTENGVCKKELYLHITKTSTVTPEYHYGYRVPNKPNLVIVGSTKSYLHLVDINTFKVVMQHDVMRDYVYHNGVKCLKFLQNGNFLCCTRSVIKLIHGDTFECLKTFTLFTDFSVSKKCFVFSIEQSLVNRNIFYSVRRDAIFVYSMKEENQIKDEKGRLQFVLSEIQNDYDLIIYIKNSSPIYGYKSLFGIDNSLTKTEIVLNEELQNLDNEKILKILVGAEFDIPQSSLFEYFVFFLRMNLLNYSFLISNEIEKIIDIDILIDLLCKSQPLKNEVPYFSNNVLKQLKELKSSIIDKDLTLLLGVMEEENRIGISMVYCKPIEIAFIDNLKEMYKMKNHNLIILSNDNVEFSADREILILMSNFFYRINSFGGIESKEMKENRKVVVNCLNGKELKYFLDFIYCSTVKTNDLTILIPLLNFADMYFEYDFKFYIIEKIKRITGQLMEKGEFLLYLKKFYYYFENEKIRNMFIDYWSLLLERVNENDMTKKGFSKSLILYLINDKKPIRNDKINEELEIKCKNYENRIGDLEKEIKNQKQINHEIMKRMKTLEGLFKKHSK